MSAQVLLTPEQSAEQLNISRSRTYDLIRSGELASVKIGRVRRVPVVALDDYVARLVAEQSAGAA